MHNMGESVECVGVVVVMLVSLGGGGDVGGAMCAGVVLSWHWVVRDLVTDL